MPYFNIVAETSENTVVTEYETVKKRSDSYQSEAALEQEFIRLLYEQGYEYLPVHTEKDLITNLRKKLSELNHYQFSDTEWNDFFKNAVANPNEHIVAKTRKIQEDTIQAVSYTHHLRRAVRPKAILPDCSMIMMATAIN